MKKEYKGWAIYSPEGHVLAVGKNKGNAIDKFVQGGAKGFLWKVREAHGYTCEPVTITRNTPDTPESTP